MSTLISRMMPPLIYLNVAAYTAKAGQINDYSSTPRPHNCISLFYDAHAIFHSNGTSIEVFPGEIIFVPWQSLYISEFIKEPESRYLTIHCNFAPSAFVFNSSDYNLQKLSVDSQKAYEDFFFLQQHIGSTDFDSLEVMERFYKICGYLLPKLTRKKQQSHNNAILSVIDYMENHYAEEMPCSLLAVKAAMSESRFYLSFKEETGLTPIEYKNHIRIRHAINLLYTDISIEEITTRLGFNSTAYFRKVFYKSTGYNPLEYKKKILKR